MTGLLSPVRAKQALGLLGRALYASDPATIWDHDTATLPRVLRKLRTRYRTFARAHVAGQGLAADQEPGVAVDVRKLFLVAAREGFQTEFMPPPWGRRGNFVGNGNSIWR